MTIETDEDIFNAAMSEQPAAEQPAPDHPEAEPETPAEQPRDEHGKFASKEPAQEPELAPDKSPAEAQVQPETKADHRIPLTEHLAEREKRQTAERERDNERQAKADLERRLQMLERQLTETRQPPKETPDVWADPEAFVRAQIDPVRQGQEAIVERISRAVAVDKFGAETVNAAMSELERQMLTNPQARYEHQRIMASDLPYVELVHWHKRQAALKEVGEDPAAYKQRIIEEALKDPEVIKRVVEGARSSAQAAASDRSRSPNIDLPSLNRATGSGGQALAPSAKTDAEMFQDLFPQR